jgi:CRISPR-associated protein Csb2
VALSIVVRLRSGRYEAASIRPQVAEWPPAPARVFCALVASSESDADWAALGWLEGAGSPEVWASSQARAHRESGWVVTNAVQAKGGSQTWPGRVNGLRQRVSAVPGDDVFALVWPEAEPDDATLGRLMRLARRVPYVGRSGSSAEVTVEPAAVEMRSGWARWQACELGTPGAVELPVPYAGYTGRLREAFAQGRRAWEVARTVAYSTGVPDAADPEDAVCSPYSGMLVFGFENGRVPVGGAELLRVTEALRQATISRVPEPVPAQVSGHGADERAHVAYVGLPDVGHPHADGHLLGVAVLVPGVMEDEDRKALLRGLLQPRMTRLRFGARQEFALEYAPERVRGLLPQRWTAGLVGAAQWTSATPVMLDRFPKAKLGAAEVIARSLVRAGYPEPADVEPLASSEVPGAPARLDLGTLSANRARRPLTHCRVRFAEPVRGPVLAGALRYLGGGMFVPKPEGERA